MKYLLAIEILILPFNLLGQKFMIINNDTLPYELKIYRIENEDTLYSSPCHTFEIINSKIINQEDENCKRIGYWEFVDKNGHIQKGNYNKNGDLTGVWKEYDSKNNLRSIKHYVNNGFETVLVEYIEFQNDEEIKLVSKPLIIQKLIPLTIPSMIFVLILFIIHIVLNIILLKEVKNLSPKYIFFPFVPIKEWGNAIEYNFKVVFKLIWNGVHGTYRPYAIINNILSIIIIVTYLGLIIISNL